MNPGAGAQVGAAPLRYADWAPPSLSPADRALLRQAEVIRHRLQVPGLDPAERPRLAAQLIRIGLERDRLRGAALGYKAALPPSPEEQAWMTLQGAVIRRLQTPGLSDTERARLQNQMAGLAVRLAQLRWDPKAVGLTMESIGRWQKFEAEVAERIQDIRRAAARGDVAGYRQGMMALMQRLEGLDPKVVRDLLAPYLPLPIERPPLLAPYLPFPIERPAQASHRPIRLPRLSGPITDEKGQPILLASASTSPAVPDVSKPKIKHGDPTQSASDDRRFDGAVHVVRSQNRPTGLTDKQRAHLHKSVLIEINGINTWFVDQKRDAQGLADKTGRDVIMVHNATEKSVLDSLVWGVSGLDVPVLDLIQAGLEKLGRIPNSATFKLANEILYQIKRGMTVDIVAHSQGTIITADAIRIVRERLAQEFGGNSQKVDQYLREHVRVLGVGGAVFRLPDYMRPLWTRIDDPRDPVSAIFGGRGGVPMEWNIEAHYFDNYLKTYGDLIQKWTRGEPIERELEQRIKAIERAIERERMEAQKQKVEAVEREIFDVDRQTRK